MPDALTKKPRLVHKIGAIVMIIAALVMLTQVIIILAFPDNGWLEMAKAYIKAERDRHGICRSHFTTDYLTILHRIVSKLLPLWQSNSRILDRQKELLYPNKPSLIFL